MSSNVQSGKQAVRQKIPQMVQDRPDNSPDPRQMLKAAFVRHKVNGERMLDLASKGKDGALELARMCEEFSKLPPDCQELLTTMCQLLLKRFQQESDDADPQHRSSVLLVMRPDAEEAVEETVPPHVLVDEYLVDKHFNNVTFQMLDLGAKGTLWMDEEGRLKELPRNAEAERRFPGHLFFGTVVWVMP